MQEVKNAILTKYIGVTGIQSVTRVLWIVTFTLLTAISAQIEIPLRPVPLTLQTFFVLLSGAFLGKRDGFLSMSLYLGLGALGLPVFAGGAFGLHSILGPSGGYLLAFPVASFAIGYLVSISQKRLFILFSMFLGLMIIFTFGTIQLNFVYFHNWSHSLEAGFLIFSVWDVVKLLAASSIYSQFLERKKT
jgi:biotin transport system substrate-specific component